MLISGTKVSTTLLVATAAPTLLATLSGVLGARAILLYARGAGAGNNLTITAFPSRTGTANLAGFVLQVIGAAGPANSAEGRRFVISEDVGPGGTGVAGVSPGMLSDIVRIFGQVGVADDTITFDIWPLFDVEKPVSLKSSQSLQP